MGALIDASVLIAVERGQLDLEARAREIADEDVALAAITASELLHGVHRADTETRRASREAWVEALLGGMPVLAFDLVTARVHARLSASLATDGIVVGAHDLLIAATALARGLEVVTRNTRSFPRIPGLPVLVWQLQLAQTPGAVRRTRAQQDGPGDIGPHTLLRQIRDRRALMLLVSLLAVFDSGTARLLG